ncbi:hypothetical protein BIW11_09114, partial [Tropilaelaps mercedesae]
GSSSDIGGNGMGLAGVKCNMGKGGGALRSAELGECQKSTPSLKARENDGDLAPGGSLSSRGARSRQGAGFVLDECAGAHEPNDTLFFRARLTAATGANRAMYQQQETCKNEEQENRLLDFDHRFPPPSPTPNTQ